MSKITQMIGNNFLSYKIDKADRLICSNSFKNYLEKSLTAVKRTVPFFESTIDVIVNDSIFPFDETVLVCDVETKEECRIKTGKEIIGAMINGNSILRNLNDIWNNPNIVLLIQDKNDK